MEVKAKSRFSRISPRKARLVVDLIRGKDVNEALRALTFLDKKAAIIVKKLVQSAVANAEQKQVIDIDNLYVKHVSVDMGPAVHRFRPAAQGRAQPIRKRISHFNLVLDER